MKFELWIDTYRLAKKIVDNHSMMDVCFHGQELSRIVVDSHGSENLTGTGTELSLVERGIGANMIHLADLVRQESSPDLTDLYLVSNTMGLA
jgi:hypothetical protein